MSQKSPCAFEKVKWAYIVSNIWFRCIWKTGELESEYTHKSELSKDSFLFVPELDYEYNNDTDDYFNYDELYELIQAGCILISSRHNFVSRTVGCFTISAFIRFKHNWYTINNFK